MSQQMAAQLGSSVAGAVTSGKSEITQALVGEAYGAAAQVGVLLPFSRKQESEADHVGMVYMARAGYDPHEAIAFWKRMAASAGSQPPEFLSTHPADERRIQQLEALLPQALMEYKPR